MKGTKSYKAAQDKLNAYVRENEMRPSRVRNMVLETMCQLAQPFTAEQLLKACEPEHISVGTVYNALNLFVDANIVRATKRQRGKMATEYELIAGSANCLQFVCKKCGRTVDFTDQPIARMIKQHKYNNFILQHYSLFVYGECKICRKRTIVKQYRSRSSIE